ncbi:MAG: efflux RND transporter periplasmic adaptor subunit [Rhodanobacteraceae bacterium]
MKRIRIIGLGALLATGVALAADENKSGAHADENPLAIDAAAQKQLGIATAPVAARQLADEVRAPGEVKANAYATVLVSSRVPAQIVRRTAKLGDKVAAGRPLVTLSSLEVAEAQGALIVATREWQRVKELGADAVSARRFTEAQVARDQANAKLRAYGVSDAEIAAMMRKGSALANGEFALLAPQAGRITTDDFLIGERVEPGRVLFTLVDETRVWIEAQIAPSAAERVSTGAAARIVAHDETSTGTVIQLSHRSVEASRTTPVRIEVANDADALHPGEFVEAFIATKETKSVISVPTEAIIQLQGQAIVFKALANGVFEPAPIRTNGVRGADTIVDQGIAAGDVIAIRGAYALKARLLKSQLGEGHGD